MRDTGYNPDPKKKPRIAATEFQTAPPRGMVWGEVHDENAWSLGRRRRARRRIQHRATTWPCWRRPS